MKHTDIKTFEDACKDQGLDPSVKPDVSMLPSGLQKFLLSAFMLSIITVSLNKDDEGKQWLPEYGEDPNFKYTPWFDVQTEGDSKSGSGLSFYVCDCACSVADVASRLTYKSEEIAEYSANQFKDLWEDYLLYRV